jgi:hypothetical protein
MEELPVGDPEHVHQPLIQTIVDELNGRGACPSTGESGARTARVMEEILAEFRSGRTPRVYGLRTMKSISTSALRASAVTPTHVRAGSRPSEKYER